MKTGFNDLDKIIDITEDKLIVLGARPAMGKSVFALNILSNLAINQNKSVLYFDLETGKEEIVSRFIISNAMVKYTKFRRIKDPKILGEELTEEDWDRISYANRLLKEAPIYIEDKLGISINEICKKARKVKEKNDIQFIAIDYLQLIKYEEPKCLSRENQIQEILKQLKRLAKELNISILVLSQLSREPENRKDHRPILTDFSDSKVGIENYADIVLFLYRDSYYDLDTPKKHIAEIIVTKNPTNCGAVKVAWLPEYLKFGNYLKMEV